MIEDERHTFFDGLCDKGIREGSYVLSKCGHDEGRIYLVLRSAGSFLYLTDGDKHSPEKPKKKRRKHVRLLGDPIDQESISGIEQYRNTEEKNAAVEKLIREFMARNRTQVKRR